MSFDALLSRDDLKETVAKLGYAQPTEVQKEAIPLIADGKDLLVSAETGTGKTAAFLLPAIERILNTPEKEGKGPRLLILVPTRELALQVTAEAEKFTKSLPRFKTICIYGGVPYPVQKRQLSKHHEILVATPGRLIDHIEAERVDFSRLEMVVLDEADRMLDMGFIDPVHDIVNKTPKNRQTLLFSATLKKNVSKLANTLLKDPETIQVAAKKPNFDRIEQKLFFADNIDHKIQLLESLLTDNELMQAVVFTATKSQAETLSKNLQEIGHKASSLHGDMHQHKRSKTLDKMRAGKISILVATDVFARGIDLSTISHVVNFDMPMHAEDYVHRIGRTGRAGKTGKALSLVSNRDKEAVKKIEEFTGQTLDVATIAGLEPKTKAEKLKKPFSKRGKPSQNRFGEKKFGENRFGEKKFGEKKFGEKKFGQQRFGHKKFARKSKKPV